MKSIRFRIIILLLAGLGGLCAAGGWLAYRAMHDILLSEFDYALKTKVNDLFMLAKREHSGEGIRFAQWLMPEFERSEHPEYFQIRSDSGEIIAESSSLDDGTLSLPDEEVSTTPVVYDIILPGNVPGRASAVRMVIRRGEHHGEHGEHSQKNREEITIVLARDTQRLTQLFSSMGIGFGAGTAVLLLLMAFAVRLVVKSGLQPLDTLARQTMEIQPENLADRFPVEPLPDELQPIVQQLNQLLERIDAAFRRERHLTAGMAHELYTPISELRSLTEVAQRWPEDREATRSVASTAHAIALQMQDLVNALLSLSRCESGLQEIEAEEVDIAELVEGIRRRTDPQLLARQIETEWQLNPAVRVATDRTMLAAILTNILKNAAEYVPEQGRFLCRTEARDDGCSIAVSNSTDSLEAEDLEHLCEPLWRKDKARTGSAHSGLGLSVAAQFCRLLGIELSAELPESGMFRITLRIPAEVPARNMD